MWAATWVQLRATEHALTYATTRATESLAAEFEQHAQRTIKDVDRMALLVKHEFEQYQSIDLAQLTREGLLVEGDGHVVLSVADAEGNIVARTQPFSPSGLRIANTFGCTGSGTPGRSTSASPSSPARPVSRPSCRVAA